MIISYNLTADWYEALQWQCCCRSRGYKFCDNSITCQATGCVLFGKKSSSEKKVNLIKTPIKCKPNWYQPKNFHPFIDPIFNHKGNNNAFYLN